MTDLCVISHLSLITASQYLSLTVSTIQKSPHFTDEDMEVQKDKVTWSRSHSWQIVELFILTIEMNYLQRREGMKSYSPGTDWT